MQHQKIDETLLRRYFAIRCENGIYRLRYQKGHNPVFVHLPFFLDERCARLAGLMPDGSLIRDLRRVYFHQKKDPAKIRLFKSLLLQLFSPQNPIFIRDNRGTTDIYTNSQTLARFMYHILQIPKSDESMRVPPWVFAASPCVKIAYLQEAFDMEGTILKSLAEIRFITKDYLFALDLQRLLRQLSIDPTVNERIGGTHRTIQYRLSIYRKENFRRFKQVGFRIPFLKERFAALVRKYGI